MPKIIALAMNQAEVVVKLQEMYHVTIRCNSTDPYDDFMFIKRAKRIILGVSNRDNSREDKWAQCPLCCYCMCAATDGAATTAIITTKSYNYL